MKELKFEDVTARYEDADGDEHEHTARIALVTPELATYQVRNSEGDYVRRVRSVTGRNGTAIDLHPGDAVVETERPGVYDVIPQQLYETTGYHTGELVKNVGAPPAAIRADAPADAVSSESIEDRMAKAMEPMAKALAILLQREAERAGNDAPRQSPDLNKVAESAKTADMPADTRDADAAATNTETPTGA